MDGRRRKTVHAARRPEERPKDASHSSTFTECTAAMLTLPSFAGPTSARSVTRTVRMRFSVGTGYTRIRGALSNLGHEIARTTVKRILHDHGIDLAPERSRRMPWKTFLQAHGEGPHGLRSVHRRGAYAGRAPAVPGLLRDRAAVPPRDHRRDPSAAVRRVDGVRCV